MTNKTTSAIDLVERLSVAATLLTERGLPFSAQSVEQAADTITRLQAALERIAHPEWGHCYTCGTPCFGVTDGCCDNPQWDRDDPEEVASKALSSVGGE